MKILDTVWKHLRRSPYQTISAILIMVVTFLIATSFLLTGIVSQKIVSYLEQQPKLLIFFQPEIGSEDEIIDLEDVLRSSQKVKEIKFVSKEDASAIYHEINKNDPLLLELVTPDILPASIEVSLFDSRDLSSIVSLIKDDVRVFNISSPEEVAKNLITFTTIFRIIGGGLIVVLILESILVVLMVTAMRIAVRRDEIQILSLIGASNWYIRKPFLAEGAIYGFLGSLIALIIIYIILFSISPALSSYFRGASIFPLSPVTLILVAFLEIILGTLIGVAGSAVAVWRYLR
jgi:cell division transport system permease protein